MLLACRFCTCHSAAIEYLSSCIAWVLGEQEACQSLLPKTKTLALQNPGFQAPQLTPSHSSWAGVPWGPTSPQRGENQRLPSAEGNSQMAGPEGLSWNLDAPQEGARAKSHGVRSPEEAQALLLHLSPHAVSVFPQRTF